MKTLVPDPELWNNRELQTEALSLILPALAEAGYPIDPETEVRWCEGCDTMEIRTNAPREVMERARQLAFDALNVPYEWVERQISDKHDPLATIEKRFRGLPYE